MEQLDNMLQRTMDRFDKMLTLQREHFEHTVTAHQKNRAQESRHFGMVSRNFANSHNTIQALIAVTYELRTETLV